MARTEKKNVALTIDKKLQVAIVPDIEQPHAIPENWCWTRVGQICTLKNGRAFKPTDWVKTGIPIVRIQNLNDPDSEYNYFDGAVSDDNRLYGGELLFAWSGTPGTSFGAHIWQGKDAVLNQHIYRVDFDENTINKVFFMYAINQQLEMLISVAHGGAGLQHVTKGVFESTPIPLPSYQEQQRIVNRIESLFTKLDEAKEKAQAVVDGFEDRKAAILHKAFSGDLVKQHNDLSHKWEKVFLRDVVSGFKYGTSEKSDYSFTGMPVLRIPNIGEDGIDFSDIKNLTTEHIDAESQIHENDILIIRSNGSRDLVGKCALVPFLDQEYAYASFLIRIKPSEKIRADYLALYLNSREARNQMSIKAKSSAGIHNINSKELGSIIVRLPSLNEQKEIVMAIQKLMQPEKQANELALETIDQINSMKKSILARAFRGELGTNDPNDESAVELLKRIL